MKVWLIQQGEELPIDPGKPRLLRTGILANMLADRCHEVVYWTSTFNHARKTQRFETDTDINVRDNYNIKLLYSPGYHKNVSIRRIYDHIVMARKLRTQALLEPCPDIILCSMPTIDLSLAATELGTKMNIPVVLDIRDMWPDIFLEALPIWANGIGRVMLSPMFRNLTKACKDATAFFGITDEFLEWGLKYAGRNRNSFDSVFYHGYSPAQPDEHEIVRAEAFWKQHGISKDNAGFIACFFGYFGRQFEIETVLEAARELKNSKSDIRFVLCGNGDNFERYKSMAGDLNNAVLPGFVGYPEIWTLMKMSSVGLAPYKSSPNFVANLPNKVGEYLSAGLPIVSSLGGILEESLEQNQCGITYPNDAAETLAGILSDLYQNRGKLENMACGARKLFEAKFVGENVYGDMINHLEHIVMNYQNCQARIT